MSEELNGRALPRWRSMLYVPMTRPDFIAKAHTRDADAIQLDLEDSVAPQEKQAARNTLPDAVQQITDSRRAGRPDIVVRINRPWRLAVRDLEAAVLSGVRAIALPKVPDAGHVRAVSEIIAELENERGLAHGSVSVIAMVETADAVFGVRDIATADPRVVALTLGAEDFATDVGIEPVGDLLIGPKQSIVFAARAAGILPLGLVGTLADWKDSDAFADLVATSRQLGFVGASAIHPSQVPIMNAGFAPSKAEVDRARRLVEAYRVAQAEGVGAIDFEGSMVDEPIARRAELLLAQAG
ncbi:HpcH/HpaI aldolase/citrate lyase family protein [Microlunatus soli]|uniref:Citrate lyase subunit beta / citryl-CoA lyase n=1 Tax=Microlunatus soli TaxID=630515 RepID=A0A1H1PCQ3_9ACTN|nr:CoA ester lyase [Microlunatus soli]SDS09056.1 citrate lyase subunit beta / citryl-CoA lyase [Microlunatus soli]